MGSVACTLTRQFVAFELRYEYPIFDLLYRGCDLLGELTCIPTDTLIDMLFVILAAEVTLTPTDVAEIVEIQCELQKRDEGSHWNWRAVN